MERALAFSVFKPQTLKVFPPSFLARHLVTRSNNSSFYQTFIYGLSSHFHWLRMCVLLSSHLFLVFYSFHSHPTPVFQKGILGKIPFLFYNTSRWIPHPCYVIQRCTFVTIAFNYSLLFYHGSLSLNYIKLGVRSLKFSFSCGCWPLWILFLWPGMSMSLLTTWRLIHFVQD